jgi:2-polyprenyl-6-methoxyphenol hydroxylase-like FAD-dependent oxidoreductase
MAKKSSFNEAIRLFESVRLKRTHDIVNASWKLGKIAQWENGISIKLRNLAFLIMPQSSYQKQLESIYEIEFKV